MGERGRESPVYSAKMGAHAPPLAYYVSKYPMNVSDSLTLQARYLFPVDGKKPWLEKGCLTIQEDRIVAVEPPGTRQADLDLGNVALLPGFVNAHTHLDLSGMRGLCPPSADFTGWLRGVTGYRQQRTLEQVQEDMRAGLAECQRYGTTLVGDIASQGLSWPQLAEAPLWAVVFLELLGLSQERAKQAYQQARTWLETRKATTTCRPGLSPHAPYSVRAELFSQVSQLLRQHKTHGQEVPVAIHLAETEEELELLSSKSGPFVDFLVERGVWDPQGLVASPEEILRLFAPLPGALFIHGNYLDPAKVQGGTVVYCPRTHAAFGHRPHPVREFLARGARVALGTDSLASNPDLSVLAEARFLWHKHPDLPGETLLRMATLHGAEALGWDRITGSLAPGKSADLVILPLPNEEKDDPHELIFDSAQEVARLMWRGQWIN
jgi:cytosine/adenosine deaminase-related metal-dependent hydrolase